VFWLLSICIFRYSLAVFVQVLLCVLKIDFYICLKIDYLGNNDFLKIMHLIMCLKAHNQTSLMIVPIMEPREVESVRLKFFVAHNSLQAHNQMFHLFIAQNFVLDYVFQPLNPLVLETVRFNLFILVPHIKWFSNINCAYYYVVAIHFLLGLCTSFKRYNDKKKSFGY